MTPSNSNKTLFFFWETEKSNQVETKKIIHVSGSMRTGGSMRTDNDDSHFDMRTGNYASHFANRQRRFALRHNEANTKWKQKSACEAATTCIHAFVNSRSIQQPPIWRNIDKEGRAGARELWIIHMQIFLRKYHIGACAIIQIIGVIYTYTFIIVIIIIYIYTQRKYLMSAIFGQCGIVKILGVHSVLSMLADDAGDGFVRANLVFLIVFLLPKKYFLIVFVT